MDGTIISWNPANWITVVLMVALGFWAISVGAKVYQAKRSR